MMIQRSIFLAAVLLLFANSFAQQVTCPDGFTGAQCSVCQSNEACQASTGATDATCSNRFEYYNNSVTKSYACEIKPQPNSIIDLTTLLVPGSIYVGCSTGFVNNATGGGGGGGTTTPVSPIVPAAAPTPAAEIITPPIVVAPTPDLFPLAPAPESIFAVPPATILAPELAPTAFQPTPQALFGKRRLLQTGAVSPAFCDVSFVVKDPKVKLACKATDCAITPNVVGPVVCSSTTCTCPEDPTCAGSGLVSALAASVSGKASFNCTETGDCSLKLEGLPIEELLMGCTAGECLIPIKDGDGGFGGTNTTGQGSSYDINPYIAMIPSLVLTVLVAGMGLYVLYHPLMKRQVTRKSGDAASLVGSKDMASAQGARVQSLEFSNICVYVPMSSDTLDRRRGAIRAKALAHVTSQNASHHNAKGVHGLVQRAKEGVLGLRTESSETYGPVIKAGHRTTSQESADGGGAVVVSRNGSSGVVALDEKANMDAALDAADYVTDLHSGAVSNSWYIVKECSGQFKGGELVGVLGPSGCGKTTLLGSLVGSAMDLGPTAVLSGRVLVDGQRRRENEVAYVPQSDLFIPTLTVDECVWYSALLRLPRGTSRDEIRFRVDRALSELGLRHVADSKVGGSGGVRGVSGGERRRVTIAMELVTDPQILVLDEPSSGLDSYAAIKLMGTLRAVAARGRVVVASLHQPSREMFMMLDQALLMGQGRMLYMGPPGEAESWFADRGVPCPPDTAIAEHMLEIANDAPGIKKVLQAEERAKITKDLESKYIAQQQLEAGSRQVSMAPTDIEDGKSVASDGTNIRAMAPKKQASDFTLQLGVMFWRSFIDIIRNPTLLLLHVAVSTFVGVVAGCIFFDLPLSSIGVQNRMGATFFALSFLAFTSLTTVDLLMNERAVVTREVRSGYYSPATYLFSKLALDGLLLRLLPAVLYWLPFYYMSGFRTGSTYAATYCFTLLLFNLVVGALSMCVTVASTTAGQSSFIMNFVLLFSLVFTGFLVNVESMPDWIQWLHYFSVFYYAFEAMMTSELSGMKLDFIYTPPNSAPITIPNIDGFTFLQTFGFSIDNTTLDICILIIFYVGFIVLALLFFIMSQSKRWQAMKAKTSQGLARFFRFGR